MAFGLPYERDVAITRHVAAFVRRHAPDGAPAARPAQRRRLPVVAHRRPRGERPRVTRAAARSRRLPDADPDLAVARGAVAYALARLGRGVRIGGGSARGYFVGIVGDEGRRQARSASSLAEPKRAPRTSPAGRTFALSVGRPVRFDLFASDDVRRTPGRRRRHRRRALRAAPAHSRPRSRRPSSTHRPGGARHDRGRAHAGGHGRPRVPRGGHGRGARRRLDPSAQQRSPVPARLPAPPGSDDESSPAVAVEAAAPARRGSRSPGAGLRQASRRRDGPRGQGPPARARTRPRRAGPVDGRDQPRLSSTRSSPARAGGDALPITSACSGCSRAGASVRASATRSTRAAWRRSRRCSTRSSLSPARSADGRPFFIAWRRISGGLDEAAQTQLRDLVDPHLAPFRGGHQETEEAGARPRRRARHGVVARAVAPTRRSELGGWVLERTWTNRDPRLWAAIGRLGARVPAYASVHHVVAPLVAERWIDHLLREKWDAVPTANAAAVRPDPEDRRPGARRQRSHREGSREAPRRGEREARAGAGRARGRPGRGQRARRVLRRRAPDRPAARRLVLFRRGTSRAPGSGARFLIWGGQRDSETACETGGWDGPGPSPRPSPAPKSRNGHPTPGRSSWHFGGPLRDSSGVVAGRVAWRPSYRETRRVQRLLEMAHHPSRRVHRWWVSLSSSAAGASEATATEARDRRSR